MTAETRDSVSTPRQLVGFRLLDRSNNLKNANDKRCDHGVVDWGRGKRERRTPSDPKMDRDGDDCGRGLATVDQIRCRRRR